MASKISFCIAVFLFFLSWCLPAYEGIIGVGVMLTAFAYHFMIIPIPTVFPVWANLTFLLAFKHYLKIDVDREEEHLSKVWMYITVTFFLMLVGVLTSLNKLNVGALIWLLSSIFLICAIALKKLLERYARVCLVAIVLMVGMLAIKIYKYEIYIAQYQIGQSQGLKHYLFRGKDTKMEIPSLVQVEQNHSTRILNREKVDDQARDMITLIGETIEVDFNNVISVPTFSHKQASCELEPNQQHTLLYPIQYLEKGYYWRKYFNSGAVAIGIPTQQKATILYHATNLDSNHTQIKIIRKVDQHVLYEQRLVTQAEYTGCHYEPRGYASELNTAFELGLNPFEIKNNGFIPHGKFKTNEVLVAGCSWKKETHNRFQFENKKINFLDQQVLQPQLLCSDHYIAVASVEKRGVTQLETGLNLKMFQREDLQPIKCGTLRYLLSESQIQAFYEGGLMMTQVTVLEERPTHAECPKVELRLSDGFVDTDYNYLSKSN